MDRSIPHSLFHDPLGNHGDYSQGIYYQGRMKYLYSSNSPNINENPPQSLEPPKDMMTNRQKKKSNIHNPQGVQLLQRLEFKRQLENDNKLLHKRHDSKKKTQLIITSKKTSPSDWIETTQAGCVFWVHKTTGDVRSSPPFSDLPLISSSSKSQNDEEQKEATGSLVYDRKEFEDLMHILGEDV